MTRTSASGSTTDPQNRRVVASVLDRLLLVDDGRQQRLDEYGVDELRRDVCRSLETLLNTRRGYELESPDLKQLAESAYRFGIPDFTEIGWGGNDQLRRFCQRVELAVAQFEPRLTGVRVELYDEAAQHRDRILRFRIRARLQIRPRPQEVVYDSVVDPTTYEFEVRTT
jgi:type VI secretion system lysozyme-like protein